MLGWGMFSMNYMILVLVFSLIAVNVTYISDYNFVMTMGVDVKWIYLSYLHREKTL